MRYDCLGNIATLRNEKINNNNSSMLYITTTHLLPDKKGIDNNLESSLNKSGNLFYPGDILISNIRPYFKKIWFADTPGITSNDVLIFQAREGILKRYLFYILSQNSFFDFATKTSKGTKMPRGDKEALKKFKVLIPEIEYQKKIVHLLSSLDQKIEVNNKIIANLEEQAQAIFKSWFVDFDPFQNEEFIDSELGMIPKGWEIGALGNSSLGKLMGSGIDKFEGEKIYLATADVVDTSIINLDTKVSFNHRPSRANMQPEPLSIWFAKMKDSRKLILVNESDAFIYNNMIFSTGFAGIKATPYSVYYLWTYLLTEEFNLIKDSYCQGTTMQAINNKNINKISIKIPPEPVLKEFSDITKPMFELISKLTQQNQTLSELRDALLPKLMSGEIDVSQISVEDEVDES